MWSKILILALLVGITFPCVAYDGNWWISSTKERRLGFLAGYGDYSVYDADQKQLANISWYVLEPKITAFVESNKSNLKMSVAQLIAAVARSQAADPNDKYAQHFPGKHGFFDGEYWRMSPPDHRTGFVEGFVDCYQSLIPTKNGFSRTALLYAQDISKWYGVHDSDPGLINSQRTDAKIADVLLRFRDPVRR
jgi:hypothetical protein